MDKEKKVQGEKEEKQEVKKEEKTENKEKEFYVNDSTVDILDIDEVKLD